MSSFPDEEENGIMVKGVRLSDEIVTGRQNLAGSEVKLAKASCSSGVTIDKIVSKAGQNSRIQLDVPDIPDCIILIIGMGWLSSRWS